MYVCMYVCMICMYVCMYVCVCVREYVCIHVLCLYVGQMPWQPMVHLWKTQWPEHEFVVCRGAEETIGIIYKLVSVHLIVMTFTDWVNH